MKRFSVNVKYKESISNNINILILGTSNHLMYEKY